jgi:hypothetical protein
MKKIGIIGTRQRNTRTAFMAVKEAFFSVYEDGDWIISGGCPKGGDAFAERIARDFGIPILILHARWNHEWIEGKFIRKYNKAAGFIRNSPIAEKSDILIACVVNPQDSIEEILNRKTGGSEDSLKKFKKIHTEGKIIIV